ncbi:MAG: hypothetical protein WA160_11595 [Pseudobdellovibrio sp.]
MRNIMLALIGVIFLATTGYAQTQRAAPPTIHKMVVPTYQQPATAPSAIWNSHNFKNELDLNLSEGYIRTYKAGGKSITDINMFAAYSYDIGNNIQVGGDAGFQSVDSTTRLTVAGTGTYNMDTNYSDSVFFKGSLGLYPIDKGTTTVDIKNEFGLYASAGKRFKLWDHINYKPMISIGKIGSQDATISIQFLNVSVNWN